MSQKSASSTIVSGGVAERMKFNSYFCFSAVMVSWIYPVVAHWGWSSSGWLSKLGFPYFFKALKLFCHLLEHPILNK